jgi:hypothetical protein
MGVKRATKIREEINKLTLHSKSNADTFGEVFTGFDIIEEHISNIDKKLFSDPNSTFLDPCAGLGSYPLVLIENLMEGLKEWEPNSEKRYKHIVEKQIFMVEIQKESCDIIQSLFNPKGKYKLNLYFGSFQDYYKEMTSQTTQ